MSQRIFVAPSTAVQDAVATIMRDERTLESYRSHPNCPVLIIADHALPGAAVDFHGGPIGTGLPVQLIYWGSWWNSPAGAARRAMITDRTLRLINSDYFSELAQYGINRPTWREPAIICTEPLPPGSFTNVDEQHMVPDLHNLRIDVRTRGPGRFREPSVAMTYKWVRQRCCAHAPPRIDPEDNE